MTLTLLFGILEEEQKKGFMMTTLPTVPKKPRPLKPPRETLNLRIPLVERTLIDRAAAIRGRTRTEFVLQAARQEAESVLLDRAMFSVTPEAYAEFLARLDAPAQPNERLVRTMTMPSPWGRR